MPLQIYNTLGRQKEEFVPLETGKVRMYVCGPTVYSDSHVGHAKSYITFDVVRRYLEFIGYEVTYVQNITDVGHLTDDADEGEDKILAQSRKEQKHPMAVAEYYTRRYEDDMAQLQIRPPDIAPRASGHIIEQIEMIGALIEKGFAYEAGGNVYFDVSKDSAYGKLSGRKSEEQESSGRVAQRSDKRSPQDFALWKAAEPNHILKWPSPWSTGYPGWHIECSAMSMKYLGNTFDIHGGGLENQFPHHECEIAQSESATGAPFVRYWMHNNMVTVEGKKMGKSLGNSSYLRDLFKIYDPLVLRFTLLQSHYRGTTEFKAEAIEAARAGYARLLEAYRTLSRVGAAGSEPLSETEREHPVVKAFIDAMNDDFNTPKAIATLYDLAKQSNTAASDAEKQTLLQIWDSLAGEVLGILPPRGANSFSEYEPIARTLIEQLIAKRAEARAKKDFAESDRLRDELAAAGVLVKDSKAGQEWILG